MPRNTLYNVQYTTQINRMIHQFRLDGKVVPKARPRNGNGHSYLPANYRSWKDNAIFDLRLQWKNEPLAIAAVSVVVYGSPRGDLDNIVGSVLDALVQAGVLVDDRCSCVPELSVKVIKAKENYVLIELTEPG